MGRNSVPYYDKVGILSNSTSINSSSYMIFKDVHLINWREPTGKQASKRSSGPQGCGPLQSAVPAPLDPAALTGSRGRTNRSVGGRGRRCRGRRAHRRRLVRRLLRIHLRVEVDELRRRLQFLARGLHDELHLRAFAGADLDRVDRNADLLFAYAQEAADADDGRGHLAVLVHHQVVDLADGLILGIVDGLADVLGRQDLRGVLFGNEP